MTKKKSNFQGLFGFRSRKWFWAFFTGAFLGLGYSSTKHILLSKVDTEQSNKENLNRLLSQKESKSFYNSSSKRIEKKSSKSNRTRNTENKNPLNQLKENRNNSRTEALKTPKKINIIFPDNSHISFTIDFSEKINRINQSAYKKNLTFFQEQDINSLLKNLDNPKITKSSRVRAD